MADGEAYSFHPARVHGDPVTAAERERRERYLRELRGVIGVEADGYRADPRVSADHESWTEWRTETGELPPDFERMPATGALPPPLRREEGGEWTRVADVETWRDQRERLAEQLQYWVYGEMPPAPGNVRATELSSRTGRGVTEREVRLAFGPDHEATLRLDLLVPDGEGPHPVFLTQWNHRKWAEIATERGYVGAVYAAADARDDAAAYGSVYPDYDFQLLARRAWAASRAVDYLTRLPAVDSDRVGLTGHSRNGKQSLLAAAFDERIGAVVPSSAGSGGTVPARLDRDDWYAGDMSYHARLRRSWFHPRWRFFVGRENRLPVDANSLVSLVAPRPCMLFTAANERTSSSGALDRVYESALSVYDLVGASDALALGYRPGDHGTATRDVHRIVDFFDRAFGDGSAPDPTERYHAFDFESWAATPAGAVDVGAFPERGLSGLTVAEDGTEITTPDGWADRKPAVRERVRWGFGEHDARPPRCPGPEAFGDDLRDGRTDHVAETIGRPASTETVGKRQLSPYHPSSTPFGGDLYYPRAPGEETPDGTVPAVVWLHPFSYNTGYGAAGRGQVPVEAATDRGLALFAYDQLGFGTRLREDRRFYDRYPGWSKMGKLVADARAAAETARAVEFVDADRVFLLGYSLGGTVALYAGALDERVAGVASVCGVPPLRAADAGTERASATLARLADLHGLQPRLGHFREHPRRIPFDFHEVLALLAPRPQLVVAPRRDWTHPYEDVRERVERAREVYRLCDAGDRLAFHDPDGILGFDYHEARLRSAVGESGDVPVGTERRDRVFDWLADRSA